MIQVVVMPTADAAGEFAAGLIAHEILSRTSIVLGVATGSSPLPLYRYLSVHNQAPFAGVTAYALDEYVGLDTGHPQSYRSVIDRDFTTPLGLDSHAVNVPNGNASDLDEECRSYEQRMAQAGGIDVQILGIGSNGHIGFNEPFSLFSSRTRVALLSEHTRQANARFFGCDISLVPRSCITQGIATVLEARSIVLVAHGQSKAPALAAAVHGPIDMESPASALQLHDNVTFVIDEAAASGLTER